MENKTIELDKREFDLLAWALPRTDPREVLKRVFVGDGELVALDGKKICVMKKEHDGAGGLYWLTKVVCRPARYLLVYDEQASKDLVYPNVQTRIVDTPRDLVLESASFGSGEPASMSLFKLSRMGFCFNRDYFRGPIEKAGCCDVYTEEKGPARFAFEGFDYYVMPVRVGENDVLPLSDEV
jgi:hypothetical protein